MKGCLLLVLFIAATSAKPRWVWREEPAEEKPRPSRLEDVAHMTNEERIAEYEKMDDESLLNAFEADLNLAPTIRHDRPAKRDPPTSLEELPPIDSTGLMGIGGNGQVAANEVKCTLKWKGGCKGLIKNKLEIGSRLKKHAPYTVQTCYEACARQTSPNCVAFELRTRHKHCLLLKDGCGEQVPNTGVEHYEMADCKLKHDAGVAAVPPSISIDEVKCGPGDWAHHGGKCFLVRAKKANETEGNRETYLEAEKYCASKQAHLPVVLEKSDEDAIVSFGRSHPELKGETPWLGITKPEGRWAWSNGKEMNEVSGMWKKGFPISKDCAVGTIEGWVDANCEEKHLVVCQKDAVPPSIDELKCGPGGWAYHGGRCFLVRAKQAGETAGHRETYIQAENYCARLKAHLPIVMDKSDENATISFGRSHPELKDETPWLGISEPAKEGLWIWSNGIQAEKNPNMWKKGFPSNNDEKDCAVATIQGWVDVNCETQNLVVCQKDPLDAQKEFKHCPDGWEYSTSNANQLLGACYWVANKEATWKEAYDDCQSKNADLISVTSDMEYDFASRITRWPYVWIGLTSQAAYKEPLEGWIWTDGHEPLYNGFEAMHRNRLANKTPDPMPMAPPPGPPPPMPNVTFAKSAWCKKDENKAYCDSSNSRWKVGNRWDDWEQYCARTPECNTRGEEKLAPEESAQCVVFEYKSKTWKKRDCNAKAGINYACKTDAWKPLRPHDPSRNNPNHFTQFSDKIGDCNTPDRMLIAAHQTCLRNWYDLILGGASVAKLSSQCPNFCDPMTNTTGDGSCVWDIACVRCDQLVSLCTSSARATAVCERYIRKNLKKSDFNRCPQFNLCYPGKGVMKQIQNECLSVYAEWEHQYNVLKYDVDHITYPCDKICSKMDQDCAWQILCKKCQLLMSLSHTGRKEMFEEQFAYVMKVPNEKRCSQYTGDVMPAWWVTGNWI